MFGIEFLMGISSGLFMFSFCLAVIALVFLVGALSFYLDGQREYRKVATLTGTLFVIFSLFTVFFHAINPDLLFEKRLALLKYEAISKENIKLILDKGVPQIERIADALVKKLEEKK